MKRNIANLLCKIDTRTVVETATLKVLIKIRLSTRVHSSGIREIHGLNKSIKHVKGYQPGNRRVSTHVEMSITETVKDDVPWLDLHWRFAATQRNTIRSNSYSQQSSKLWI